VDASGGQPAVFPDSPAAAAGLKAGDVITEVDGTAVSAGSDLAELMLPHQPGDTITLTVLRGSAKQEVQVKLGTLPQQP
jgi:S1-C subfamily serine protease